MGTNACNRSDLQAQTAAAADLIACRSCRLLSRPPAGAAASERLFCPRCGAALSSRKPYSLARTWILLLTGALCYIPANLLPVTISTSFGSEQINTIFSGVIYFFKTGSWVIGIIIFVASIMVPVVKLLVLAFLALSVHFGSCWRPEERTALYRVTESIGRWSMVDVFAITVLVGLLRLHALASMAVGPGAFFFGAVVVITMLAARSFDPRLIWDAMRR